jgi:hypothetical protein
MRIMFGKICSNCESEHGPEPAIINKWHECGSTDCGALYCSDCVDNEIEPAGWGSSQRICKFCGGITKVINEL